MHTQRKYYKKWFLDNDPFLPPADEKESDRKQIAKSKINVLMGAIQEIEAEKTRRKERLGLGRDALYIIALLATIIAATLYYFAFFSLIAAGWIVAAALTIVALNYIIHSLDWANTLGKALAIPMAASTAYFLYQNILVALPGLLPLGLAPIGFIIVAGLTMFSFISNMNLYRGDIPRKIRKIENGSLNDLASGFIKHLCLTIGASTTSYMFTAGTFAKLSFMVSAPFIAYPLLILVGLATFFFIYSNSNDTVDKLLSALKDARYGDSALERFFRYLFGIKKGVDPVENFKAAIKNIFIYALAGFLACWSQSGLVSAYQTPTANFLLSLSQMALSVFFYSTVIARIGVVWPKYYELITRGIEKPVIADGAPYTWNQQACVKILDDDDASVEKEPTPEKKGEPIPWEVDPNLWRKTIHIRCREQNVKCSPEEWRIYREAYANYQYEHASPFEKGIAWLKAFSFSVRNWVAPYAVGFNAFSNFFIPFNGKGGGLAGAGAGFINGTASAAVNASGWWAAEKEQRYFMYRPNGSTRKINACLGAEEEKASSPPQSRVTTQAPGGPSDYFSPVLTQTGSGRERPSNPLSLSPIPAAAQGALG